MIVCVRCPYACGPLPCPAAPCHSLTALPASLGQLTSLKQLDVSQNKLMQVRRAA